MRIPTFKDLNFNVKKILWSEKPKTFSEFKTLHSASFAKALGAYLARTNHHNKEYFSKLYQIIFYYGFINFKRELELMNLLTKYDFEVNSSTLVTDAVLGIDLIANKDNIKYLIQVKTKDTNIDLKLLPKMVNNVSIVGVLAIKTNNKWTFKNVLNCEQIDLLC